MPYERVNEMYKELPAKHVYSPKGSAQGDSQGVPIQGNWVIFLQPPCIDD